MNLIQKNIEKLRDELHQHNYYYYVLDKPLISDFDFDMKLKQLNDLENKYDMIILKHVFEHLYDPLKDLEKIYEVCELLR